MKLAFYVLKTYGSIAFWTHTAGKMQMTLISEEARNGSHPSLSHGLLGSTQRAEIAGAVSLHALHVPNWIVELSHGISVTGSTMISPDDGEDISGPTVIITAENGAFRLEAFRWDCYWTIGEYRTWAEALCETRKVVAWEGAVPRSIH